MQLDRLTPTFAALNRTTANAILRNENATLAKLRAATAKATNTMARAITVANVFSGDTSQLVILGSARSTSFDLRSDISGIILAQRQRARELAHTRLDAEFDAIGVTAQAPIVGARADAERASAAADTFTRAWVASVTQSPPGGKATASTVKAASGSQDYRLRRIAATENAQAYSAEHAAAATWVAQTYRGAFAGAYRRWEAILDKAVCNICRSMDGQLAPLDGPFMNGWEPGNVHPFCRCFDTLVLAPRKRDTGAGLVTKRKAMTTTLRPTAPPDNSPWGGGGQWGGGGSSGSF